MSTPIQLTDDERSEPTHQASKQSGPAALARRARLILLLEAGHSWVGVRNKLDCSNDFIASWNWCLAHDDRARLAQACGTPWFAKIECNVIARGVFTSITDLKRKLMLYIRKHNKAPKAVKWKYYDPTRPITTDPVVIAQ
jgi:hypothetical protein